MRKEYCAESDFLEDGARGACSKLPISSVISRNSAWLGKGMAQKQLHGSSALDLLKHVTLRIPSVSKIRYWRKRGQKYLTRFLHLSIEKGHV